MTEFVSHYQGKGVCFVRYNLSNYRSRGETNEGIFVYKNEERRKKKEGRRRRKKGEGRRKKEEGRKEGEEEKLEPNSLEHGHCRSY